MKLVKFIAFWIVAHLVFGAFQGLTEWLILLAICGITPKVMVRAIPQAMKLTGIAVACCLVMLFINFVVL